MFVEPAVQHWFLERPALMRWTNKTYSFIHIPGTILYLIVLYHVTTARPRHRLQEEQCGRDKSMLPLDDNWRDLAPSFGPAIYERRRRTMAMCNLLAFIVFTFWPCMPPRLLSDPTYTGEYAAEAKGFGFVDTVHGADGDSSVWTTNRFCNQYGAWATYPYSSLLHNVLMMSCLAAMPSLHPAKARPPRLAASCGRWRGHDLPGRHPDRHRGDGEPLRPGCRCGRYRLHYCVEL
jgi:hypothetical protein